MTQCPGYVAPFGSQLLQGGRTGPYDCTAWSDRVVIAASTCGHKVVSGRTIRLQSDEPVPDPRSPGLNLQQAAAVAAKYGVYLDVRNGYRKVSWAEYERRRLAGQPAIIQVNYGPIADSRYDAGRGFRGGHAIAETVHATYDSLADGRVPGVFKFNGTVYTRALMREGAGKLIVNQRGDTVGAGYVYAAFGRDVIPSFKARVPKGNVLVYFIGQSGVITGRTRRSTGGFSATCTPPKSYRWPAKNRTATLVELTSGTHAGWHISANYAEEA